MSHHGLVAIAVRIAGIFVAIYAVKNGAAYISTAGQSNDDPWLWLVLTPVVMMAAAAVCMIAFPQIVAGNLIPAKKPGETESALTAGQLEPLACSLIGLYFLAQSVFDTTYVASLWFVTKQLGYKWVWAPEFGAVAVTAAVEFIVSMWLLFRARGLLGLLKWARSLGSA